MGMLYTKWSASNEPWFITRVGANIVVSRLNFAKVSHSKPSKLFSYFTTLGFIFCIENTVPSVRNQSQSSLRTPSIMARKGFLCLPGG